MKSKDLHHRIALVTGASRGIGRAIAQQLADAGATVLLVATDAQRLESVAADIGPSSHALPTDLRQDQAIKTLVTDIHNRFGHLDILVNNAGITFSGDIESTTTEDWDRCMTLNAKAAFLLCRESLPLLRQGTDPCIVNLSSVVGIKGYAQQTAYTASKHALRGFSLALAEELHPQGIRVHVVCPGAVDTDMVKSVRPDIPTQDLIAADEVAQAVTYLISQPGQGIIDEIRIRRRTSGPWF